MDWTMVAALIAGIALIGSFLAFAITKAFNFGGLASNISNLSEKFDRLENRMDRMDGRMDKLGDKLERVNNVVVANNDDLNTIKAVLNMKYKNLDSSLTVRHSPRVLNELGEKLFREMKGEEFLQKNKDVLFARIDKDSPKAALDVEQAAQIACLSVTNQDFFVPIKTFVYNCPLQTLPDGDGKQLDVDVETACYVLGIKLRDLYLSSHKEIPTA